MNEISSFFEKFKKLLTNDTAKKQIVSDAINDMLGVKIDPNSIRIKNAVATIPSTPVLRSELMIKKHLLLKKVKEKEPSLALVDIR
jgi:hypothetical protein